MPEREEKTEFSPRDRALTAAFIASAAGWAAHLNVSYFLVPESCGAGSKWMLHLVTAICLAITLASAAVAWRVRASTRGGHHSVLREARTKFMSEMVTLLALGFTLVIIAQEIPNLILGSCD